MDKDSIIKIIDFGSSRRVAQDELLHGVYGTSYYVAPEVLEGGYTQTVDVWSVGILIYLMLAGTPPFDGASGREVIKKVRAGQYSLSGGIWDEVGDGAKDLISRMLAPQEKRITAAEAFAHPWFETAKAMPSG